MRIQTRYIQQNKMSQTKEYSITLIRLFLPKNYQIQKVCFSVTASGVQIFTQGSKNVKNNKVNFYRQNLVISSIEKGITFSIYTVDQFNHRHLLKTVQVGYDQLYSINKRPALFHTKKDNFEIVWECGRFYQKSSDENDETDRQYTQFRNNNGNAQLFNTQTLPIESLKNTKVFSFGMNNLPQHPKRSNSTDSQTFGKQNSGHSKISLKYRDKENTSKDDSCIPRMRSMINKQPFPNSDSKAKVGGIRSHFIQFLKGGISGLFSSRN